MVNCKILASSYDAEGAKKILLRTDYKVNIMETDEVFYPYVMLQYSAAVGKGRLSKLNKRYDCVVDGVLGSAYEGKGKPALTDIDLEGTKALGLRITAEECHSIGHDFALKLFLENAKLLMTPEIQLLREDIFYKKFYVMHCLDEQNRDYYVMIDAVDGGLSVLDH
jgi:hypothetical protein